MDGEQFLAALKKQLGVRTQEEVADALGMYQPQISALANAKSVTPTYFAKIVARLSKQVLRGDELVPQMKKRLGVTSVARAAESVGMTTAALCQWQNQQAGITSKQVCNVLMSAQKQAKRDAHATAYRPIIEMFPISPAKKTVNSDVFSDSDGANHQRAGLKAELKQAKGLYIFYDARGRALYVGQAAKQSIWTEMNHAYNRQRQAQKVALVQHPVKNVAYSAAHERLRQPKDTVKKLVDLAAYFSAYEVDEALIKDFEALFIRAFPNDLLNYKMEKFRKGKTRKTRAA